MLLLISIPWHSNAATTTWSYVDFDSGESLDLSLEYGGRMITGEFAQLAQFCSATDSMHCFDSRGFGFAVPKKFSNESFWKHKEKIYCVYKRYRSKPSLKTPDNFLIFSKIGSKCGGIYTQSAFYSKTKGLRSFQAMFADDTVNSVISTEAVGFGAINPVIE